jgi:Fe-S cluster assembly scaffold protein SufB
MHAQKKETAKLKEELIQAGLRHDNALKESIKAGKAEVEESKSALIELHEKEVREVHDRLHQELQEEKRLRGLERQQNNELEQVQISYGTIIKDLDDKVRSKYFSPCL